MINTFRYRAGRSREVVLHLVLNKTEAASANKGCAVGLYLDVHLTTHFMTLLSVPSESDESKAVSVKEQIASLRPKKSEQV